MKLPLNPHITTTSLNGKWKYVELLLYVYIITIPINGIINLPTIGRKIQLPEIVFIMLLLATIIEVLRHKTWQKFRLTIIDKALSLYGLALLISCLSHLTSASIFEFLGFLYLLVLYLAINIYFLESGKNIRQFLVKSTQMSSILAASIGLIGLILITLSINNPFVVYFVNYPLLGSIYRLKALTTEPIMLMSILGVFTLIYLADIYGKTKVKLSISTTIILILLATVMFFTYTKSIVMFTASCFIIIATHYSISNKFKNIVWGIFLTIFLFFSHFTFVSKTAFNQNQYCHALEKQPIFELSDQYIVRTCYAILKESNIIAFSRNPIIGLGGGNFTKYVEHLKEEQIYPSYIPSYDPLSTYFGSLSELGILGFISLLILYSTVRFVWVKSKKSDERNESDNRFWILMCGVLMFIIAEGFVTDTMNFRHYWLVLACFAAKERTTISSLQLL
jgi:hypothetical protein